MSKDKEQQKKKQIEILEVPPNKEFTIEIEINKVEKYKPKKEDFEGIKND